jgi:hypothetical protein
VIGKKPDRRPIHPYQDSLGGELIKNKIKIMVNVRVKFSADLIIDAESYEEARLKWEQLPLFSQEAKEYGVEYCETLLMEDADTYEDVDWY